MCAGIAMARNKSKIYKLVEKKMGYVIVNLCLMNVDNGV